MQAQPPRRSLTRCWARQAVGYHAGEITGPGTLVCTARGGELHLPQSGHIPPCPKCHGLYFKRPDTPKEPVAQA